MWENTYQLLGQIITALGGSIAVLIVFLSIFKSIFTKYIEQIIITTSEKSIEKLKNSFTRSLSAYELLLKKEFDYFESVDFIYADLIVEVLDLTDAIHNRLEKSNEEQRKDCIEHILKILNYIPVLKNKAYIYQAYIPRSILTPSLDLVGVLQNSVKIWDEALKNFGNTDIDYSGVDSTQEEIIRCIASVEAAINIRLHELSSSK